MGTMADEDERGSIHDRLVRHTLSIPENAAGELRAVVPVDVVARID